MSEIEKKEVTMNQGQIYKFDIHTYSPITKTDPITGNKLPGSGRFSIASSVYIDGVGFDRVDPFNKGNELMIGYRNFVRMQEVVLGYSNVGNTSEQITNAITNLWGSSDWDGKK